MDYIPFKYNGESSITIHSKNVNRYRFHYEQFQHKFIEHCRSLLGNSYLNNVKLTYPIVGKVHEMGILKNTYTSNLGCTETHDFYFLKFYPNIHLFHQEWFLISPKTVLGYWIQTHSGPIV